MEKTDTAAAPSSPTAAPSRRQRGEHVEGSQELILTVAREQFAAHGYTGATIRGVARAAGVDPKLVMHFFTNKDGLFTAALALPDAAPARITEALTAPADEVAERLVHVYVGLWEDRDTAAQLRATLRSMSTSDKAADLLRALVEAKVSRTDLPFPSATVAFGISQLLGAAIARYILRIAPLAELTREEFTAALIPTLDATLRQG